MFIAKKLLGLGGAQSPAPELSTIDGGRLFLVRPESIKGSRECIFIDASISIRRTSYEYQHQLVVTRTYQEGEEQLLEENAENFDERVFLLDSSLFLSLGPTLDPTLTSSDRSLRSLTWLDPDGDSPDDEYEFVLLTPLAADGEADLEAARAFERLAWVCMWERENSRSWPTDARESAALERTLEATYKCERRDATTAQKRSGPPLFNEPDDGNESGDSDAELAAALGAKVSLKDRAVAVAATPRASAAASSPAPQPNLEEPATTSADSAEVSVHGELHLYDRAKGYFVRQDADVVAELHATNKSRSGFWLLVRGTDGVWISQSVEEDMAWNFSEPDRVMSFNYRHDEPFEIGGDKDPITRVYTWLVRFADTASFDRMQAGVMKALFESKVGENEWAKLKDTERDYVRDAYVEDVEMDDLDAERSTAATESEDEFFSGDEDEGASFAANESDHGDDDDDENRDAAPRRRQDKNSQLAVGYKGGLSFVLRGDMIGVFKASEDGNKKLEFVTNIKGTQTPDGKSFAPAKMMLHEQDSSMVLQNPLKPGSLYRLDLTRGSVVEEYKVSDDITIADYLPSAKFAQTTAEQTFVGVSHNALFRIDPRLSGDKLVDSQFKQYKTNNDFAVASSSEAGYLAVGSKKGDLRLFDTIGKNAKTLIPALGDPIIGVDVTADGKWVLATCQTYILLIDTTIKDGQYAGRIGFERSFPAAAKPKGKRLQLKPQHVAELGGVSFTPAHFDTTSSGEQTIVTSTGDALIAWNFTKVRSGRTHDYVIRRHGETIAAGSFKYGTDKEIIVTLPQDVLLEDKKRLRPPTRNSLAPVVKTWDQR